MLPSLESSQPAVRPAKPDPTTATLTGLASAAMPAAVVFGALRPPPAPRPGGWARQAWPPFVCQPDGGRTVEVCKMEIRQLAGLRRCHDWLEIPYDHWQRSCMAKPMDSPLLQPYTQVSMSVAWSVA